MIGQTKDHQPPFYVRVPKVKSYASEARFRELIEESAGGAEMRESGLGYSST